MHFEKEPEERRFLGHVLQTAFRALRADARNRQAAAGVRDEISAQTLAYYREHHYEGFSESEGEDERSDGQRTRQAERVRYDRNLEKYRLHAQNSPKRKTQEELLEEQVANLRASLQQAEERANYLQKLLEWRNEEFKNLTIGYLKDLVHLKEMRQLSNQAELDGVVTPFEVKFSNETAALDAKSREIFNNAVEDLKSQFDKKLGKMYLLVKKYEQQRNIFRQKYEDSRKDKDAFFMMKVLHDLEKNPYVIWKLLQDAYGNENIFRIFETQKEGYGINWLEVDKHLANSAAGAREFRNYRLQSEKQYRELVESTRAEIDALRAELLEKDNELLALSEKVEKEVAAAKLELEARYERQYIDRELQRNL